MNNSTPDCAPDGKNVFAPGVGYEEAEKTHRGKAFALVIPGMILSMILLKLSGGLLIASAIGSLVMVAGFSKLWKESGWFRACTFLSVLHMLWCYVLLVSLFWVYNQTNFLWHVMHIVNLALFFCAWKGMALKKRGTLQFVALIVGYGALIGLGYADANEFVVVCKAVAAVVCALSLSWMQKLAKE